MGSCMDGPCALFLRSALCISNGRRDLVGWMDMKVSGLFVSVVFISLL